MSATDKSRTTRCYIAPFGFNYGERLWAAEAASNAEEAQKHTCLNCVFQQDRWDTITGNRVAVASFLAIACSWVVVSTMLLDMWGDGLVNGYGAGMAGPAQNVVMILLVSWVSPTYNRPVIQHGAAWVPALRCAYMAYSFYAHQQGGAALFSECAGNACIREMWRTAIFHCVFPLTIIWGSLLCRLSYKQLMASAACILVSHHVLLNAKLARYQAAVATFLPLPLGTAFASSPSPHGHTTGGAATGAIGAGADSTPAFLSRIWGELQPESHVIEMRVLQVAAAAILPCALHLAPCTWLLASPG
jgi:hypothetical protein